MEVAVTKDLRPPRRNGAKLPRTGYQMLEPGPQQRPVPGRNKSSPRPWQGRLDAAGEAGGDFLEDELVALGVSEDGEG
ncbi:hypothetical protein, partial [Arthrobacter sp. MSA 4-2]|uniref:hypothetical protein n=1 Tax=Arthrobacter sp. MSA 4-2 TaxID=2794349 RepID=UPI001E426C48